MRVLMVAALLAALTWTEVQVLADGGPMPNRPLVLAPVYKSIYQRICQMFQAAWEGAGAQAGVLPSERAVKEAAKRWTKAYLLTGSVLDKPSNIAGRRLQQIMPHLEAIKHLIMLGYTDDSGQTRLYRSLADMRNRSPEFNWHREQHGMPRTMPALWRQLRRLWPRLNKVQLRLKKLRNAALVQVRRRRRHKACKHAACHAWRVYGSIEGHCDGCCAVLDV